MVQSLLLGIVGAGLATIPGGDHALYLAQRYAQAGEIKKATELFRAAGAARPACAVVVKLKTAGAVIPLCAPSSLRRPAWLGGRIGALRARAANASARDAARLLEEARRLDPFDARLVEPLARALRTLGREGDARRMEAEAEALRRGRTVLRAHADR
jgi:predicted Zn-dependent protease